MLTRNDLLGKFAWIGSMWRALRKRSKSAQTKLSKRIRRRRKKKEFTHPLSYTASKEHFYTAELF